MTSFLMSCPQCGLTIAKGSPCVDCHWSDKPEAAMLDQETTRAFARRQTVHVRNYAVFMVLMFGTGLVALLTSFMWIRIIYLGSVVAFFWLTCLSLATGVLSVLLVCAKKLFPVDLNCPCCNLRLDELGTEDNHCPGCDARLK